MRKYPALWAALWLALVCLLPLAAPHYRAQDRVAVLQPPSPAHWLGTDDYGRDVAQRLLVATRNSTLLGAAMALPPLLLALLAALGGGAAPRSRAWWRGAGDVSLGLPWIFLLVAVRAALPLNAGLGWILAALLALFALAAWPATAWGLGGAARNLAAQDFVLAARGFGAGRWQIMTRHLWPNLRDLAATYFMLLFAAAVAAEVSLALVGLGVPEPAPTWGNMLLPLRDLSTAGRAWWLYAPLAVFVPLLAMLSSWSGRRLQIS